MTRTLESVPTYSDYFCGFGGSSQGARKLGLNIRMAAPDHRTSAVHVEQEAWSRSVAGLAATAAAACAWVLVRRSTHGRLR